MTEDNTEILLENAISAIFPKFITFICRMLINDKLDSYFYIDLFVDHIWKIREAKNTEEARFLTAYIINLSRILFEDFDVIRRKLGSISRDTPLILVEKVDFSDVVFEAYQIFKKAIINSKLFRYALTKLKEKNQINESLEDIQQIFSNMQIKYVKNAWFNGMVGFNNTIYLSDTIQNKTNPLTNKQLLARLI